MLYTLPSLSVSFFPLQAKDNLEDKLEDMRATLQSQKADNCSMQDLLAKVQEDKRRLGVRVNKLTNNGELKFINNQHIS